MQNKCEGLISNEECKKAIKDMPNNTSPGTDGLPIELYKVFWNEISETVLNCFNYSYNKGELSISQKQGIITLLPKKDKDTKFLKNWRPISLLNTDYKILTKCLAARMKAILPNIIHHNQTGFLKNRYIGRNIRLLMDIIDIAEEINTPGMICSIDFEKAFDTISWTYLDRCLDYFGFGHSFKKWVNIIQRDSCSCVINSGWSTGFFNLGRGARQGCPLSPYIFLLCVEILGISIRNSPEIVGMHLYDKEFKLSQFADDTQLILDGSQQSLDKYIQLLDEYQEISGLKVNFDKSEIICIGSCKDNNYELQKLIKFQKEHFKVLGITIPVK